jgi:hypothetical protein
VIDAIIHDAVEDVVGPRRVLCIGDCTRGNRHILDPERYGRLHAKVSALMANAWGIEDDDPARRRKRKEYVAEEHRLEEEHDLAERVRTDKELAGYREAIFRPVGFYVHSSVGEDGTNEPEDVKRVAKRLHELGFLDTPTEDLDTIGDAIYAYQGSVLRIPNRTAGSTRAARPKPPCGPGVESRWRSNSRASGSAGHRHVPLHHSRSKSSLACRSPPHRWCFRTRSSHETAGPRCRWSFPRESASGWERARSSRHGDRVLLWSDVAVLVVCRRADRGAATRRAVARFSPAVCSRRADGCRGA